MRKAGIEAVKAITNALKTLDMFKCASFFQALFIETS